MNDTDLTKPFCEQIRDAAEKQTPLSITAGGSKDFYGRPGRTEQHIDTKAHCGVLGYEPSELVVQARSGTLLRDIEKLLADNGQMLAFEPPHFGETSNTGRCHRHRLIRPTPTLARRRA